MAVTHRCRTLARRCSIAVAASLLGIGVAAAAEPATVIFPAARDANAPAGLPLRRLLDVPMRDPNVARGPDGFYYLTGTTDPAPDYTTIRRDDPTGQMWTVNDGVRAWRSPDGVRWESLGLIWSLDRDGAGTWAHFWPAGQPNPGTAVWAPEMHYVNGTWWIAYCGKLPGHKPAPYCCSLLRSSTGKPTGPYRDVSPAKPLGDNVDASLFQDTDAAVYYLWGACTIARMTADMTGLAERPRRLAFARPPGWGEGVFLSKVDGRYVLTNTGTASPDPAGKLTDKKHVTYDCFSASAASVYGPYTARVRAVPHAGHQNLFQDAAGQWWTTLFGSDPTAPVYARPCVLPVTIDAAAGRVRAARSSPRPTWRYATTRPSADWASPAFHDNGWPVGGGAFGDPAVADHGEVTDVGTPWTASDVWLRATFTAAGPRPARPALFWRHDGAAQVFLNGRLVADDAGVTADYVETQLADPSALHDGANTLAVHCATAAGWPAYVDVGVVGRP